MNRVARQEQGLSDRVCFCCGRRESRIDHVRVGPEGSVLAKRMRDLMTWYAR